MVPVNRVTWQNPRILSTLLLVFLCGAMAGALAMSLGAHRFIHKTVPYWDEGGKQISLQRFTRELDLTPDQAKQLETVLDDFMKYYRNLQSEMDEVRATGKENILRILNEDQKRKFEKMINGLETKRQ
jgi:Spy/CpxP family protein refolding chaperone